MNHLEAGRYWEANAEAWTVMSRLGYDLCRDLFNTPGFLQLLPDVNGLRGLDLGCGEGHNTRLLAKRGAHMTGFDIAPTFVRYARRTEVEERLGIQYLRASAIRLPFAEKSFDFVTAFMSLQDMPEQECVLAEAFRVLAPGGFLQFSITHPCFHTPKWEWVQDETGRKVALLVGDYFRDPEPRLDEWTFDAAPDELKQRCGPFKVVYFDHTLSDWLNLVLASGFQLEAFAEPSPDDETLRQHPEEYTARLIAWFLIIRCRKGRAR